MIILSVTCFKKKQPSTSEEDYHTYETVDKAPSLPSSRINLKENLAYCKSPRSIELDLKDGKGKAQAKTTPAEINAQVAMQMEPESNVDEDYEVIKSYEGESGGVNANGEDYKDYEVMQGNLNLNIYIKSPVSYEDKDGYVKADGED